MYQKKQQNIPISPKQFLQQLRHLPPWTHSKSNPFDHLRVYISQTGSSDLIQNCKLFARILGYYSRIFKHPQGKEGRAAIGNLLLSWRKQIKSKTLVLSSLEKYVMKKLQKMGSPYLPTEQTVPPDIIIRSNQKQCLTYRNYEGERHQIYHIIDHTDSILQQIVKNNYHLPNPNCIGCSETIYEEADGQSLILMDTGQYCKVLAERNNPTFDEDLTRTMAVCLSIGGGYILVTNSPEPKMRTISFQNQSPELLYKSLYNKIAQSVTCIQPANLIQAIDLKFLYVANHFLLPPQDPYQNRQLKFVFKIKLKPVISRIFYLNFQVKANKSVVNVYNSEGGQAKQVLGKNIYELILKRYMSAKRGTKKPCMTCMRRAFKEIPLIRDEEIQENYQNCDEPVLKYRYSAILILSSNKYTQLVTRVNKQLSNRKIVKAMCRPYKKFTSLAERVIWCINHDCDFNDLNRIIKQLDIEQKSTCIIVTNFLQIKGGLENEKKKRFELTLANQFPDCRPQIQSRLQKVDAKSNKQMYYTYYRFDDYRHAIFSYIYLDGLGVRGCQFVKEYHFMNEHKGKG